MLFASQVLNGLGLAAGTTVAALLPVIIATVRKR